VNLFLIHAESVPFSAREKGVSQTSLEWQKPRQENLSEKETTGQMDILAGV
jgi:hypothetical protein